MVFEEGIPINRARKEFGMKYPTAKSIVQRYRKALKASKRKKAKETSEEAPDA
jgi:hypothetical protein